MNKGNLKTIIKGSALSIIITIICLFIFSIILAYTNVSESYSTPIIIGIVAISIIIGSLISAKKVKEKGLINGGCVGIIYILSIYLLSSIIIGDFSINLYTLCSIGISIIVGIIGGIIGVNLP